MKYFWAKDPGPSMQNSQAISSHPQVQLMFCSIM